MLALSLDQCQFEGQNVGGGGGEGKLAMTGSKLDSRILSFWGEGGERKLGKTRKIRVVQSVGGGERETPLAKTTAMRRGQEKCLILRRVYLGPQQRDLRVHPKFKFQ